MKNLFALTAAVLFGFSAAASNVQLIVQAVDNGDAVPGNTYRVYAELPSNQHSLHAIFADGEHLRDHAAASGAGGSFLRPDAVRIRPTP